MTVFNHRLRRNGALAISPLGVMALLFVALSLACGGFHAMPLPVVFLCTAAWSLVTLRGLSFDERLAVFSRGAGQPTLLLMVWIFVLAGAFAATAKAMGAIDAIVALCLDFLPAGAVLPGLFLTACFVSLSIGTSVGTIVALVPIASGLADQAVLSEVTLVGAVVGGAFFGDNLSFISDTTVVATKTQGCRMQDKFRANFRVALPAALLTLLGYGLMGRSTTAVEAVGGCSWALVLPYLAVLVTAIAGLNVLLVLTLGVLLTGVTGVAIGAYDVAGWLAAACEGIGGMGELILVSMLAGGLLAVIRKGGGITWLIRRITLHVHSPRGAQLSIAALVSLTNLCTANNTVAILSVGPLARDISARFGVEPRRAAGILDTFSCVVQGLIPYGAQLLMAGGLAGLAPTAIVPHLYYPVVLGGCMLAAILFGKKGWGKSINVLRAKK